MSVPTESMLTRIETTKATFKVEVVEVEVWERF